MAVSERLQKQIQRLSLADKQVLSAWLSTEIALEQQPPEVPTKGGRKVVKSKEEGQITYQAELIKCGKPNCRCMRKKELHGPYWYGYQREKGKLKSWYIGKELDL